MSNDPSFPDEIIFEILCRVPVKSLCRFKCVAKPIKSLISHPSFVKAHLKHHHHHNILIVTSALSLYSIDFQCNSGDCDSGFATKLEFTPLQKWAKVLGSCDGLLLVSNTRNTLFIFNPSTRETQKVQHFPWSNDPSYVRIIYGFGYDSCCDEYKVIMISYNHNRDGKGAFDGHFVDVYSVRTRKWTRTGKMSFYDHPGIVPWQGVFLNGSLHWLAKHGDLLVIAAFDLTNGEFKDVRVPTEHDYENIGVLFYDLLILGGYLCVVACRKNFETDIWMLKKYDVRDSWVKFTISKRELYPTKPFALHGDKEILLKVYGGKMVRYNFEDQTSTDVSITGIEASYEVELTALETLISPNCDGGV